MLNDIKYTNMQHTTIFRPLLILLFFFLSVSYASESENTDTYKKTKPLVYIFEIKKEIGPASWRIAKQSMAEAHKLQASLIILHLNTYGGMVNYADSIRTILLNSSIPVYVFIDNNAASAGALISIACDRIYMRKGANIGAASVVTQDGKLAPDKYQSYMRAMMRATAEAHGKDTIVHGKDTTIRWKRDPKIAQAMVGFVSSDDTILHREAVLTLTADEAIEKGFCEGIAENISEVIALAGISDYQTKTFYVSTLEKIMGFLVNPAFQGLMIMLIIGGIYYELQSPGIGFPLAIAILGAILYFAPLYLEGLAAHWEILVFIVGLLLLAAEIFVIPGFGVTGISGIILIITSLALGLVDNVVFDFEHVQMGQLMRSFALVIFSMVLSLGLVLYLSGRTSSLPFFSKLILQEAQEKEKGFVSADNSLQMLIGQKGKTATILKPSGKIIVNDNIYDAVSEVGFIEKDEEVLITHFSANQLYVKKA